MRDEANENKKKSPESPHKKISRRKSSSTEEDQEQEVDKNSFLNQTRTPHPSPFPLPPSVTLDDDEEERDTDEEDEDEDEDEDDEGTLFEILIETLTGTTFQVRVSPWETGAGLKALLHRTQGIPSFHQHLLLGQEELVEDLPLIDQGVQEGAKLRLVLSLKGGPINARKIPQHDDGLWREFQDYMDFNKEELWDEGDGGPGGPGRPVTLLVLREGDAVNLYRVVENEDGSFSPLNESWSSSMTVPPARSGRSSAGQSSTAADHNVLRDRLTDVMTKMEALKLKKKERRIKKGPSIPVSPRLKPITTSKRRKSHSNASSLSSSLRSSLPFNTPRDLNISQNGSEMALSNENRRTRRKKSFPTVPHSQLPSVGNSRQSKSQGNSKVSTHDSDKRRLSLSRSYKMLDEIPRTTVPRHVEFSRHRKLESIRPTKQTKTIHPQNPPNDRSLGPLKEDSTPSPEIPKHYNAYRKSLVKHGIRESGESGESPPNTARNSRNAENERREAWPGREGPVPLYMPPVRKKRNPYATRLHQSYQLKSLHPPTDYDDRPKTSPEILERRPPSAALSSVGSNVSEQIHLKSSDETLIELISILNTSRASSRQSLKENDIALCKTPSPNQSLKLRKGDFLQEFVRSKGAQSIGKEISRRSTPDRRKRPSSNHSSVTMISPKPTRRKKKTHPRCSHCNKKIGVATTYVCRCNRIFCATHRYSEAHECSHDYKAEGRKLIELANPLVIPPKLPKI